MGASQSSLQVLTAQQMRDAEKRLFDAGMPEFELMKLAASRAAEWVRRLAAGRAVTVLCGPGNNGGDGYVIAHCLHTSGLAVKVVAPEPPKTPSAKQALALWGRDVVTSGGKAQGDVLVDCLFGSGLSRPLSGEHALLLRDLAERHRTTIALDVPSGISSDSGELLNERLPSFDVTLCLGAWKFAHFTLPARAKMGVQRLVPIGIDPVEGAAEVLTKPRLSPPALDAHKYTRGLGVAVGGAMPGATVLAGEAALRGGAGYIKLAMSAELSGANPCFVTDTGALREVLDDARIRAVLIGPGLGRDGTARARLIWALSANRPIVLDADALDLLRPEMIKGETVALATPHDGELEALCRAFAVLAPTRRERVSALARAAKMVVVAKGPNTIIAAPNGRQILCPSAPSWLSVAGSGDVLAGIALSRMANGASPIEAACEAVWLHGEAARACGPAFTAHDLARALSQAVAVCV